VKDTRTLSPQAQEELRRRVVATVEAGMNKSEASRTFHVSRTSIVAWMKQYEKGGEESLAGKPRGRPKESRLDARQTAKAKRLIEGRCPDQFKLPFALWTREAVGDLLKRQFDIEVSVWTAGRYLKAWGFTPQKPVRRAYERDPKAVERWLDVEYPAIAAWAKRENALIHWGDDPRMMGLRSDHQTGTSYALRGPRGKTPAIPGTGQRFGCNMISAITNRGQLSFMVFQQRFTAPLFITFLRRRLRQRHLAGRKCFLIVDGHPAHRSAKAKAWIADHADRRAVCRRC
jgi:transposase